MERIVIPVLSSEAARAVADLANRPLTEVVAVAVDVGQGVPLNELRDVALAAGALRCHVFERSDQLAAGYLWPALRAGLIGVTGEPIETALSAPCVAEAVVEVARLEAATAVAAAAASRRERQRLLAGLRDLAPELGVVTVGGGAGEAERNVWAGVRELAPGVEAATGHSGETPPATAHLLVRIEHGVPVALNRVAMPPVAIIDSLATIARVQRLAPHVASGGAESPGQRWLVDAPAAAALQRACAVVAEQTLDAASLAFAAEAAEAYARLVRDGHWFTRLRGGLDAFAAHVFDAVSGEVEMTMGHGRIEVAA